MKKQFDWLRAARAAQRGMRESPSIASIKPTRLHRLRIYGQALVHPLSEHVIAGVLTKEELVFVLQSLVVMLLEPDQEPDVAA